MIVTRIFCGSRGERNQRQTVVIAGGGTQDVLSSLDQQKEILELIIPVICAISTDTVTKLNKRITLNH